VAILPFGASLQPSRTALENKMFSDVATKQDLQQLKREFECEFAARMCLILAGAVALLFGLLKIF